MCRLFAASLFAIIPWLQPVHANEKLVSFWECVDRVTPATTADGLSLKLDYYEVTGAQSICGKWIAWISRHLDCSTGFQPDAGCRLRNL